MTKQTRWDRCLYCDASIAGGDAQDATLHDPYCPHGKSLRKNATLVADLEAQVAWREMSLKSAEAAQQTLLNEIERLQRENEALRKALQRSLNWLSAYPGGLALGCYDEARAALDARGDEA